MTPGQKQIVAEFIKTLDLKDPASFMKLAVFIEQLLEKK